MHIKATKDAVRVETEEVIGYCIDEDFNINEDYSYDDLNEDFNGCIDLL